MYFERVSLLNENSVINISMGIEAATVQWGSACPLNVVSAKKDIKPIMIK
jgi:hypothetical protein